MDLAKLIPKFEMPKNVFEGVAKLSDGVASAKEFALDCKAIKDFALEYNSEADEKFELANPVPPAKSPDLIQILYFGGRSVSLSLEMVAKVGEFAKKRLAEKNS